jgi:hypothetical protein
MKFKFAYLLFAAVLMISCERKLRPPDMVGSGTSGIIGIWKLTSTSGITGASSEIDILGDILKAETNMQYTSSNHKGYYNITSTEFNGVGIGYDFAGNLTLKVYENDVLQSEITNPVNSTIAPVNITNSYKPIGNDSIYFTGTPPGVELPSGTTPTGAGGCKYKLEGNKLTMFTKYNTSSTSIDNGFISKNKQSVDVTVVLERQ